jgi:hypothetical protein
MIHHNLPTDRALTLADFAAIPQGQIVRLYYWCYNKGDFRWLHDRVEGDRVFGQFCYDEERDWSELDDYLYEYLGVVARGSGAEPVWAAPPTRCDLDDEDSALEEDEDEDSPLEEDL